MRSPLAAWVAASVVAAASPAVVAQVSPGALSAAHERLDNPRGCLTCHGPGGADQGLHCLDCHRESAGGSSVGPACTAARRCATAARAIRSTEDATSA